MSSQLARQEALPKTDYSILINRVKSAILHNEDGAEDTAKILNNRSVWQKLNPEEMAEWASLSHY